MPRGRRPSFQWIKQPEIIHSMRFLCVSWIPGHVRERTEEGVATRSCPPRKKQGGFVFRKVRLPNAARAHVKTFVLK
jgi:hypothetical protein